ncbi:MAG: hypothetical protein COA61_005175 [Zetaproteobacteria bacterium]|nr:hypothetical protein [Zetaproteobacteria bacterium]
METLMEFTLPQALYHVINTWHWVVLTLLPVACWFYEKEGTFPYRSLAILLILGDVIAMSSEHVLHSTKFYWHVNDLDGVDDCFLVAWFGSLTLIIFRMRYIAMGLSLLPLFLVIYIMDFGLLSVQEAIYAILLGLLIGSILLYLSAFMQRLTYGIEQLLLHHGSIFYPFSLLVLFDINQNLMFFTATFHFMFGYGT